VASSDSPSNAGRGERERSSSVPDIAPVVAEFGKYYLLAVLGRGGMGDVYLAMVRGPLDFKKLVVIKRLREGCADDERILTMFLDEGRIAARLNHPNLVQTHEVGEFDGMPYIAMEYLEGQPIARFERNLDGGWASARMAARIISDALSGLHYAHELRDFDGTPLDIVHRDLSPQNIFVTYEGMVKIVDFGIAKTALAYRTKTEAGTLKGKLSYIAPEQVVGDDVDRRADLFSIGVVLWELVSHRRLFDASSAAATLNNLISKPIPRLSSVVPTVDPDLDAIVARSLEKDADTRFQTALEMHEALEKYIASSGPPILHKELGAFVNEKFKARRWRIEQQIQACVAAIHSGSASRIAASSSSSRLSNVSSLSAVSVKRRPDSEPSFDRMASEPDDAPTIPRFAHPFPRAVAKHARWAAPLLLVATSLVVYRLRYAVERVLTESALPAGPPVIAAPAAPDDVGVGDPSATTSSDVQPSPAKIEDAKPDAGERTKTGASAPPRKTDGPKPAVATREANKDQRHTLDSSGAAAARDALSDPGATSPPPAATAAPSTPTSAPTPGRRKFRTEF
jgi:serine/threonine protein kinase